MLVRGGAASRRTHLGDAFLVSGSLCCARSGGNSGIWHTLLGGLSVEHFSSGCAAICKLACSQQTSNGAHEQRAIRLLTRLHFAGHTGRGTQQLRITMAFWPQQHVQCSSHLA
jgi:hypothetical protein